MKPKLDNLTRYMTYITSNILNDKNRNIDWSSMLYNLCRMIDQIEWSQDDSRESYLDRLGHLPYRRNITIYQFLKICMNLYPSWDLFWLFLKKYLSFYHSFDFLKNKKMLMTISKAVTFISYMVSIHIRPQSRMSWNSQPFHIRNFSNIFTLARLYI